MSDTDTRAALDAALEQYRAAPMGSSDRTTVDRAIAAHVEAEVARRLAAADGVDEAIEAFDDASAAYGAAKRGLDLAARDRAAASQVAALDRLCAAIAADKARAVEAAHDGMRRVYSDRMLARDREAMDALAALDEARAARLTLDETRRLVDAYGSAVDKLAGLGYMDRPSKMLVDDLITKHNAARTALLRALGVEP